MTTDNETPSAQHPMTPVLIAGELYSHDSPLPRMVRLGTPAPDPLPGGDYYCPIEIQNPQTGVYEWETAVFGVNALQAVENVYAYLRMNWPLMPPAATISKG